MRIHYFQHVPYEGLGNILPWIQNRNHGVTATHLYRGEPPPDAADVDWLIVMGGPMNIYEEDKHPWLRREKDFIKKTIDGGKRVLGVCLGAQLIADALGAEVHLNACREIGWYSVEFTAQGRRSPAFAGLPPSINAFHWHSDSFSVPTTAVHAARSRACAHQAFVYDQRVVGLQFHLETTPRGAQLLMEHCGDQNDEAACTLLADRDRFTTLHRHLWRLLDNLQEL